ncbi:NAD(P)-binding protein [Periconia macrospinosa]|uniref:NAD(P)-binding protein n=1 Tax=Periconia macrospinosa TaxID=97972 RepID=A0A2V1DXM1_9PLEO|nr:NAD(P)-binding protein [Periconia macrospinosa]
MSTRVPDTKLTSTFTPTIHSRPSSSLDPSKNTLPTPLTVCIVGASRGIGAGIATSYARALAPGSTLFIVARESSASHLSTVQKTAQELNPSITVTRLFADITSAQSVAELATSIQQQQQHNSLDVVVLNSGWAGPEVVLKMTEGNPEDFQNVFDINAIGTYHVVHYLVPLLLASENADVRQLLVVSSFASILTNGPIANTAYCVSKMAQVRLVEFASEQFGKEENGGLTCAAVHPGAVLTESADDTCPDVFRPYLTDDVELCGAFCVWMSREKRAWLNGRLLSAKWDVDELTAKKDIIEQQDLLKLGLRIGDISIPAI